MMPDKIATNESGELQKFFSVASIAQAHGVHEDTILRAIHSGKLKAIRWGRRALRIAQEELERFVQSSRLENLTDSDNNTRRAEQKKQSSKHVVVGDVVIEDYIYRDCKIEILCNNKSKKYFALSSLPGHTEVSGRPIGVGLASIRKLKRTAEAYVNKRIIWQEKRRQRKVKDGIEAACKFR
jgi:excisionase family DNA binding protein